MELTSTGNLLLPPSGMQPNNIHNSDIDLQSHIWSLMQKQWIELLKTQSSGQIPIPFAISPINTIQQKDFVLDKSHSPDPMKNNVAKKQFSIENILKVEDVHLLTETAEMSSPSSSSTSSASNAYTLQSLEHLDRRTTNKSSSSQRCVCDICGKSYATTSNLSRHKQTHRPIDSPHAKQCPHCDRVYVSMPALSMHILTHNATHECKICGKRFSRLWLLQGHLRSHSGVRPFSCAYCGKSFADRSNLRAHILTHTGNSGDKRYECDNCGRRFALRAYLNRHMETCLK